MSAPDEPRYWLYRPESIDEEGEGLEEETIGPFSLKDILKMFRRVDHDGYTGDSFYWREGMEDWRPLRAFAHYEFGNPDKSRVEEVRDVGIKYIEWLTAGHDDECAACKTLEGKVFPVDEPPPTPPVGCRCELWCKCMFIGVETSEGSKAWPKKLER